MSQILAIMTDAYNGKGGIARYNRDWLAAMSAHRIDLICKTTASERTESIPAHVRVLHAASGRMGLLLAAFARLRRSRPDWIWCGHLHLAPVAALLAWFWQVPLWLQVHGIDAWQQPGSLRRRAAERAQLITAVSRHTRRELLRWWRGAPERVRVLPNTVNESFAVAHMESTNAESRGPILLTVGRLSAAEAYKGQDRVLRLLPDLLKSFPHLCYQIAGDGDDQPRLAQLALQVNVSDHVDFLGHVSDRELPALYRRADVMVMPSTGEGFGIAFLESMACGTPAIGLKGDGSADALQDGALGDCVSEDQLLAAITRRLHTPMDRPDLASRARQAFGRPHFDAQTRTLAAVMDGAGH